MKRCLIGAALKRRVHVCTGIVPPRIARRLDLLRDPDLHERPRFGGVVGCVEIESSYSPGRPPA